MCYIVLNKSKKVCESQHIGKYRLIINNYVVFSFGQSVYTVCLDKNTGRIYSNRSLSSWFYIKRIHSIWIRPIFHGTCACSSRHRYLAPYRSTRSTAIRSDVTMTACESDDEPAKRTYFWIDGDSPVGGSWNAHMWPEVASVRNELVCPSDMNCLIRQMQTLYLLVWQNFDVLQRKLNEIHIYIITQK